MRGKFAQVSQAAFLYLHIRPYRSSSLCSFQRAAGGRQRGLTGWKLTPQASASPRQTSSRRWLPAQRTCGAPSRCALLSERGRRRRRRWRRGWAWERCVRGGQRRAGTAADALLLCCCCSCALCACRTSTVAVAKPGQYLHPLAPLPSLHPTHHPPAHGAADLQVGGAHWLSEAQPTEVNVAAAEEAAGSGRSEGSVQCSVVYSGGASGRGAGRSGEQLPCSPAVCFLLL